MVDFTRLRTLFLDSFYQNDPHTSALLVDYLWVPGVASSDEFILDTSGYCELVARDRERTREIGMVEINKVSTAVLVVVL
jgi:hypothetical protein